MIGKTSARLAGTALAGAMALTLAVGARAAPDRDAEASAAVDVKDSGGQPFLYGELVTDLPWPEWTFAPQYDAVLYLQFGDGAHVTAKHAFFPTVTTFPGANEEESEKEEVRRVICALNSIKAERPDAACPMYQLAGGIGPILHNFEHFVFGSQQRIYIFVENDDVAFNRAYPISFTPFGSSDIPSADPQKAKKHPNYSFYEARYLQDSIRNLDVLVLNNYFNSPDGDYIRSSADNSRYSLNINLLVCKYPDGDGNCDFSSPREVLPIVVDPDTGNGWGYGP